MRQDSVKHGSTKYPVRQVQMNVSQPVLENLSACIQIWVHTLELFYFIKNYWLSAVAHACNPI
jgi:hypothetical protein